MRAEILHYFTFPAFQTTQISQKYFSQIGNFSQPYDRTQIADCRLHCLKNYKSKILNWNIEFTIYIYLGKIL